MDKLTSTTSSGSLRLKEFGYMYIARFVGHFYSKCYSRQIGAVLVTPDGTIVGTGYNGPPRGYPTCDTPEHWGWLLGQIKANPEYFPPEAHDLIYSDKIPKASCPRRVMGFASGQGLNFCPAAHAEENLIVNSAREGIKVKGCTVYLWGPTPCSRCASVMINAGIRRVVCLDEGYDPMGQQELSEVRKGGEPDFLYRLSDEDRARMDSD